jgi:hypothetical protein
MRPVDWVIIVALAVAFFIMWTHVITIDDHGRRIHAIENAPRS